MAANAIGFACAWLSAPALKELEEWFEAQKEMRARGFPPRKAALICSAVMGAMLLSSPAKFESTQSVVFDCLDQVGRRIAHTGETRRPFIDVKQHLFSCLFDANWVSYLIGGSFPLCASSEQVIILATTAFLFQSCGKTLRNDLRCMRMSLARS